MLCSLIHLFLFYPCNSHRKSDLLVTIDCCRCKGQRGAFNCTETSAKRNWGQQSHAGPKRPAWHNAATWAFFICVSILVMYLLMKRRQQSRAANERDAFAKSRSKGQGLKESHCPCVFVCGGVLCLLWPSKRKSSVTVNTVVAMFVKETEHLRTQDYINKMKVHHTHILSFFCHFLLFWRRWKKNPSCSLMCTCWNISVFHGQHVLLQLWRLYLWFE